MNNKFISKIGEQFLKLGGKLDYHSPKIFIIGGIASGVVTVVMACIATTKVDPVIKKTKDSLLVIHEKQENPPTEKGEDGTDIIVYSEKDAQKELLVTYTKAGWELAKLYLPSIGVGCLSIVSILAGSHMLHRRNVALVAAYTTIDQSFKEYRNRILAKYGAEAENEIRNGLIPKLVTDIVTDENGKQKKEKRTIYVAGKTLSDYARYFDSETSEAWESNMDFNEFFLAGQQSVANDKLRANKILYLNEVYDSLGIKRCLAGQHVGWIYNPELGKDNYVDFNIQKVYRETDNGALEEVIILDFNVDGVIHGNAMKLNLIEE